MVRLTQYKFMGCICERFTENLVLKKTQGKKENELP
jgi:hypothetical protein